MELKPFMPIYECIKDHLRGQIERGELVPGDRVPSEQELAHDLNVSRGQTRQALRDLEMEGYVLRSPGRGTFVAPPEQRRRASGGEPLPALMVAYQEGPIQSQYVRDVIRGLIAGAHQEGFQTTFYYLSHNREAELEFLRRISSSGVHGLALWPYYFRPSEFGSPLTSSEGEIVRRLSASGFPCVLFDRTIPDVEVDYVATDNRAITFGLTKALLDLGHRSIAYVCRDLMDSVMQDRLTGYQEALAAAGVPYQEKLVAQTQGHHYDGGNVAGPVRMLLESGRPSAVVFSDDLSAHEVLSSLSSAHPEEAMAVAAVTDEHYAHLSTEGWFLARQNGFEVGVRTAQTLIERVRQPRRPVSKVCVPPLFGNAATEDIGSASPV
jgi:GntR family transcriptional regulator, arabinose operon transcriptional repressor